jgi:PAS domain S-box-containing protein
MAPGHDWPPGSGEMAGCIRTCNWSDTPLGASETWPERFRAAVELMLACPLVCSIVWGKERVLLYNDLAAKLYGANHPRALGRPLPATYPEGWSSVAPHYERVFAGQSVVVTSQELDLRGDAGPLDVFDAYLTPLLDASGTVVAAQMIGIETGARLRAESLLRQSEQRQRRMLETDAVGVLIFDAAGTLIDSNDAFLRMTGWSRDDVSGGHLDWRRMTPPEWIAESEAQMQRFAETGRIGPYEKEYFLADGSRSRMMFAGRDLGDGTIVEYAVDVSAHRKSEQAWRESEEHKAFLLRIADAIRPLADPAAIQAEACRILAGQLDVERAYYVDIDEEAGVATVARDYVRAGGASLAGEHPIAAFAWSVELLRQNRHLVGDTRTSPQVPDTDRAASLALDIVACMGAPLVKDGRLVGALCVTDRVPRSWTRRDADLLQEVAERIWAAVERARAETALRESERRFRLVASSVLDHAIFITDPQGRIREWFAGAELVFGWSAEEITGKPADVLFTPNDRAAGYPERELETARRAGVAPDVRWHLRKDGVRRFIDGRTTALRDPSGQLRGFVKIGQDITDRYLAEEALRESEERFKQFGEASNDVLWIRAADDLQTEYVSPAFERVYGASLDQLFRGNDFLNWTEIIHPEDRERATAEIERVRHGERAVFEYRIRRSDGSIRWLRNSDFPFRAADGRVVRIGGIGQDITEEKEHAERMNIMVRELHHRTRNLIGIVQSIVYQTFRSAGDMADCQERLNDRLQALSNAQTLLSRSDEGTLTLEALIKTELLALAAGGEQHDIDIDGPDLVLNSSAVQVLALVFHELVTNARKYGFLTQPGGRLRVQWSTSGSTRDGTRHIDLCWAEFGRLSHAEPVTPGYGRQLVERAIPHTLGGEVRHALAEEGIRWEFRLPFSRVARSS